MQQRMELGVLMENILLFMAYYLSGHLALHFLAAPYGNTAAIWPPAGISLAAALVRGYHVLPAVFIGAWVISIESSGFSGFAPILFSLIVGFQACLSAFQGVFLINGLLGKDNPLLDTRAILRFFLLGGPVSQILSALIVIGTAICLGMSQANSMLLGFFNWWMGGCIGVFLFTPLTLSVISPRRDLWRPRFYPVFLPLISLCIVCVWCYNVIRSDDQESLKSQFHRSSSLIHRQIVEQVGDLTDEGDEASLSLQTYSYLSRNGLDLVGQSIINHRSEIVALSRIMSPYLPPERNAAGENSDYVVPHSAVGMVRAFVSSASGKWEEALLKAEINLRKEWIGPLSVPTAQGRRRLIAQILPIGHGEKVKNPDESTDPRGFLVAVFDYGRVQKKAIDFAASYGVELEIKEGGSQQEESKELAEIDGDLVSIRSISLLGRSWDLVYRPTENQLASNLIFSYWNVLTIGFFMIGLVGFVLLWVTGQTLQTRRLADIRTCELSDERRQLESILNTVKEGIVACDLNGNITMVNRAAIEQYGLELFDLPPQQWIEQFLLFDAEGRVRLHPLDHPLFQALGGKAVNAFEIMMKSKRGLVSLSVNSQPIRSESGNILGAVASIQDITELKKNAGELKKLSLAVCNSSSAILISDTAGRIEYVNDKFEAITGYTKDEIVGRTPSVLKSGRTRDEVYKELWGALLNGRVWNGEIFNRKKNGNYFWTKQFISPVMNEQGKVTHYVNIMEDITEIRGRT